MTSEARERASRRKYGAAVDLAKTRYRRRMTDAQRALAAGTSPPSAYRSEMRAATAELQTAEARARTIYDLESGR